jgi:hypothetical protein
MPKVFSMPGSSVNWSMVVEKVDPAQAGCGFSSRGTYSVTAETVNFHVYRSNSAAPARVTPPPSTFPSTIPLLAPPPLPSLKRKVSLAAGQNLAVWRSNFATGTFLVQEPNIVVDANGNFRIHVDVDDIVTITTTTGQKNGNTSMPPADHPFPTSYADDFEAYTPGNEAK